jgi:uncharacterized repeat protein (TIGR01451 family)
LIDRLRVVQRWEKVLSFAFVVALLPLVAVADDPCTKLPDLWLPPNGTQGLAGGGVSVQVTSGDVCEGEQVTVTVTVDNLSCGDAGPFDVTVFYDDSSHVIDTQRVDGLAGCEYTTLTFVWDTDGVPPGYHDLIACADTGHAVSELNEANNCLTFDVEVLVSPNAPLIEATKTYVDTNGATVQPGDTIRFDVVLRNSGCADQRDNPGHEFTDTLPAGMTATGFATASRGTIAVNGNEIVWDGDVPSGGTVTLVFKARIDAEVEDLTDLCNQGYVRWDSDGDGTNESSDPTDDPDTGAGNDPTCLLVQIGDQPPPLSGTIDAPTLSEWGMIVLACLFAVAFLWSVRRWRPSAAG